MSSSQGRPNGELSAASAVFSYAQAAKGRAAATTATAIQSHQSGASGVTTPTKETGSIINTPLGGSERGDRSVNGSLDLPSKQDTAGETATQDIKSFVSVKSVSTPASPSFGTASTATLPREPKDGNDDFTLARAVESNRERVSQNGHAVGEKSAEQGEGRRTKKTKKQKNSEKDTEREKDKEKEEIKQEFLVPAPLPTVNFWQQRKEELAKIKPTTVVAPLAADFSVRADPTSSQKKRGKVGASDDEKHTQGTQNGARDGLRGHKKGPEGTSKAKEDQTNKRAGPRGSRVIDKDEKLNHLPPPVEDAISWPTPETIVGDEKRKPQERPERDEKDDGNQNKNRPKWVTIPFVPPVIFNTPMPTRGGRGRGGGRGGRAEGGRPRDGVNGTSAADKAQVPSNDEAPTLTEGDGALNSTTRAASQPTSKKQQSEQGSTRKPLVAQTMDKTKASRAESSTATDGRTRNGVQLEFDLGLDQKQANGEVSKFSRQEQLSNAYQESHIRGEQKHDSSLKGVESYRENGTLLKENVYGSRDRSDGRSERGRGGFRGRGVHGNFTNGQTHPQHSFITTGQGSQPTNGYTTRQNSAPYSPPLQQAPFSNQYAPTSRGRGGSRSQSIPGAAMYGRYGPNGGPLSQHMAPIQTSNPMYDYQHLQPLSAAPYNSYVDDASLVQLVTMQLEYYFSIDNLCKDVYLRKHMDSQGFVFLSFIAGFKRIKALTTNFELLKFACQESAIIDVVQGEDGQDRIRRAEGWEKWIMALDDRDETVRNAGPSQHLRPHLMHKNSQMGSMVIQAHHSMSPLTFSPDGMPAAYPTYGNGVQMPPQTMNGHGNYHPETPLSAAVAEFSPSPFLANSKSTPLDAETTFHDDEVANLTLVFASSHNIDDAKPKVPFHNPSSRTFSNGSIDGRSIAEELHDDRQGRAVTNGGHPSDAGLEEFRRSRSPLAPLSPTNGIGNGPPVMWAKGQRQQAVVSEHNSEELYATFRLRTLKHRETSAAGETHPDMSLLYEFWSHFLCRNFNAHMYTEFRDCALQDAQSNAMKGVNNLISYYDEILNSKKKVIPECLARHYIDLVQQENPTGDRPAFEKLRAAWRNGALDVKSRKQIDNLIDPKLRDDLDRAPLRPKVETQ